MISGSDTALLSRIKNPVEVTTALAFILFDNGFEEFAIRLPFAFASVAAVMMLYLLGREMFGERAGFVAGLLLALEGLFLAVSRLAQYQGIVMLMSISAVYCFWRARSDSSRQSRTLFIAFGSVTFGFACLTHYEGITTAPLLGLLFFSSRQQPLKEKMALGLLCAALVVAIAAPFYVPLAFSGQLGRAWSYLADKRLGLGEGLYNNVSTFVLQEMLFRDSVYYVIVMLLATGASAMAALRRHFVGRDGLVSAAWVAFITALAVSIIYPELLQVGSVNLTLVLCLPLLFSLLFRSSLSLALRATWLWFVTLLIVYGYLAAQPGTHWYRLMPAWALISGVALETVIQGTRRGSHPWITYGLSWAACLFLTVLFGGYLFIFFIRQVPEYALTFPQHKNELVYWTPQTEPPPGFEAPYFGAPRQNGWEVVAALYRTGTLRGHLRYFGGRDTLEWYLGHQWDWDDGSRYVLHSAYPELSYQTHNAPVDELPKEAIEEECDLTGRVTVRGKPKILIYECPEGPTPRAIEDYAYEYYEPVYDRLASLDERLKYRALRVDSKTCYEAAGLIHLLGKPGESIVFTDPDQIGPFSYHYSGTLPYHIPAKALSPGELDAWLTRGSDKGTVYVLLWALADTLERRSWDDWAAQHPTEVQLSWYGNCGLALYTASADDGDHPTLLQGTRLGDSIHLLAYGLDKSSDGGTLTLTLYWSTATQIPNNYTVFTHIVNGEGRIVAQKDSQPGGGTLPTREWRTDKVIRDEYEIVIGELPAGRHRIEVGMYDHQTGERLVVEGEGAGSQRQIRLPTPLEIGVSQRVT
ncbi:MAG: glycosyltransferase family 39 protein [Candidatus Methanosuratus sp.]|nr:glycosyltransferase family 39 protein [Candidatus Methanosuratincola sp.]